MNPNASIKNFSPEMAKPLNRDGAGGEVELEPTPTVR